MADNKGIVEKLDNRTYLVKLSKEYYDKEAVFVAAEKFKPNYYVKIDSLDNYVGVYFLSKNDTNDTQTAVLSFCNEAIEQQTKLILNKQFGSLRELIYKYAFEPVS